MALPFWFSRSTTTPIPLSAVGPTLESWFVDEDFQLRTGIVGNLGDVTRLKRVEHEETGEVVWIIWIGEKSYVCWASKENQRANPRTDMEVWWARLEEARTVKIDFDVGQPLLPS